MNKGSIHVGQVWNVMMLGNGNKPTGQTRMVQVLRIDYHFQFPDKVRQVEVVTVDNPPRRAWVEPKYLEPVEKAVSA